MKIFHVQSVLPREDMAARKVKTGETSFKEAVIKPIYHYLTFDTEVKL